RPVRRRVARPRLQRRDRRGRRRELRRVHLHHDGWRRLQLLTLTGTTETTEGGPRMPVRFPKRIALTVLCLAAPLALVACGGNDNSSTTAASSTGSTTAESGGEAPAAGGGGETVKIGETEYQLSPSTVNVKPGEVTFDVSNDGQVSHSLEVE